MRRLNRTLSPIVLIILLLSACKQKENISLSDLNEFQAGEYTKWSVKMADSEMYRLGDSLMFGGPNPKAKWQYTTGLFSKSLLDLWQVTHESKYFDYVKKTIDSFIEENGDIKTYKMTDYNLDKINSGKVLLRLYKITNDNRYKQAATILYEQLQNQPRTSEGGFWHKQRYPWQMWLDGIYMSGPFYAEYGLMFNQPKSFDEVIEQIKIIDMHTRDSQSGLRYHGWDESNKQAWADPETGNSPHFWGRALGWYSMALVDILDFIPTEYENRNQILYILQDLLSAVKKYQDDSGLWYQVLDQGDRSGNYLESSCSAMFVYTFAKAVHKGYIDQTNTEVANKGYQGLINNMVSIDKDNKISLHGICSVAGLGGDPYRNGSFEYYISEPVVANDLKGVGPFIMAGLQMEKMMFSKSE